MALQEPEAFPGVGPPKRGAPAPTPVRRPAPFTPVAWALVVACVGVFIVDALSHRHLAAALGLYGPAVERGELWRALTGPLVHGGLLHLAFNLSAVFTLGRVLEAGIGSFRFAVATLAGALGSACGALLFDFDAATIGISGVILGWGGALLPIATRAGRQQIFIWLAQVAILSFLPGVSWAAHLGGFVFGLPCGQIMRAGPRVFATAAPILLFVGGVLLVLIGFRKLTFGGLA